jgi:hypothetical protein
LQAFCHRFCIFAILFHHFSRLHKIGGVKYGFVMQIAENGFYLSLIYDIMI